MKKNTLNEKYINNVIKDVINEVTESAVNKIDGTTKISLSPGEVRMLKNALNSVSYAKKMVDYLYQRCFLKRCSAADYTPSPFRNAAQQLNSANSELTRALKEYDGIDDFGVTY